MARAEVSEQLWNRFHQVVNMSSFELREFLGAVQETLTDYPADPDVDLPVLGRQVLSVLSKRRTDVTDEDEAAMRSAIELIEAWLANPPPDGMHNDPWRHGLMTLGHDPLAPQGEPPG